MSTEADETCADYADALKDLTINSKPMITSLTMLAQELGAHDVTIACRIGELIERHIRTSSPKAKLCGFYLMDSIAKNVKGHYVGHFAKGLADLYISVYQIADSTTHKSMSHLFDTWRAVFPQSALEPIERILPPRPQKIRLPPPPPPGNYNQAGGYPPPPPHQAYGGGAYGGGQSGIHGMPPANAGAMLASMVQGCGGDISALLSSIAAAKKATTAGSPTGSTGVPLPAPPAGAPPPKGKRGDSPGASTGASKENQPPRLTPDFDPARDNEAELRKRREYLIDAMYGDMPHQCASTGRRFDDKAELDAHLDLQALRRRRRKEGTSSRRWCVDGDSWIAGAAAEAADDAPAFFEVDAAKKEEDDQRLVDLANSSVPKDDDVTHCALSGEPFEVFYKEDEDEWHFKKATTLPRDYKGVPAGSIVLVTALPKDADYDDEEEEEDDDYEEAPAPEIKEEPEMIEDEREPEEAPSPTPASKKRKAAVKVKHEVKEEKVEAAVEAVATRRSKRRKSE